jgi:ABC-type multidrug transport system fused ATPase/permease subunit
MNSAKAHAHPEGERPLHLLARSLSAEDRRTLAFFLKICFQHKKLVLLALVGALLAAVFEGVTLGIFALALHVLTVGSQAAVAGLGQSGELMQPLFTAVGRQGVFFILIALAVASQLLRSSAEFMGEAATAYLRADVEGDVRRRVFRQIMAFSYPQVSTYKAGDLASYNEQVNYIGLAIDRLNAILSQGMLMAAYVFVLLWLSWQMTVAAVIALLLLSLVMRRITGRIRAVSRKFRQYSVKLNERTVEFVYGFRLVRTFAREQYAIERVDTAIEKGVKAKRRGLLWQASLSPLIDSTSVLGIAIFLIVGYYFMADSQAALARLATYLFTMYRLLPRVSILNKNWGQINGNWPFIERLADFLRTDDKQYQSRGHLPFGSLQTAIAFHHVSLRYHEEERQAVQNLSLVIPKGSMVALVGESGAGKTTITNLLLRLYEPTAGLILVDETPLSEIDLDQWLEKVGVVGQDAFVLNASIRDNIAFGRLQATAEEIVTAAKAAHAHEFITDLAEGYDTVIGDQGHRLSGGQRQRLAIARAILRQPDILILDEATSDLDSRSEKLIQQAIETLRSQRTVIAIAHRLSTIVMADQILVMHKGEVVEQGQHESLLAKQGLYARMWQLQVGAGNEQVLPR